MTKIEIIKRLAFLLKKEERLTKMLDKVIKETDELTKQLYINEKL